MRRNVFNFVRLVAVGGSTCALSTAQDNNVIATFKNPSQGYTLQHPLSWHTQIASDIFSIVNFPPASAIRGTGLAKRGAGIHILTSSQAIRDPQKLPGSLDEFVALDNAHQNVIGKRTVQIGDGHQMLMVIEAKTICCDPTQESVNWYFEINDHMFVGSVFYWQGDPDADKLRETLKQVVLSLRIIPEQTPIENADTSRWKSFANRAGWTIRYPPNWQAGSCVQCPDPTDPSVFVTFYNPSTRDLVMIEHLIDKPDNRSEEQWLDDIKRATNLSPQVSEDWITLAGVRALRVINRSVDSTESENIYLLPGSRTFAIRAGRNVPSYAVYQRMLSTFRFSSH